MTKMFFTVISGVIVYVILKKYNPEYAVLAQISTIIIIFLLVYPHLCDIIDLIYEYSNLTDSDIEYFSIVIKSLGIALIAQLASDICRDNGSGTLASQIEFAGKLMMITAAVPIINSLVRLTIQFTDSI